MLLLQCLPLYARALCSHRVISSFISSLQVPNNLSLTSLYTVGELMLFTHIKNGSHLRSHDDCNDESSQKCPDGQDNIGATIAFLDVDAFPYVHT